MENQKVHYTLWANDIKSSWINELGLNFNDYTGFDQGNVEKFIKLLIDLDKKIMGKQITIS